MNWHILTFEELTKQQLYQYIALRIEVFVIEQNCPYQDLDDKDQLAWHLLGFENETLVACARIFEPGIMYKQASIGRVITKHTKRGTGLGHILMQKAVSFCNDKFHTQGIAISAQAHLDKFYNQHGFECAGEIYLEDNIPHIKMLRQ